MVLVFVAFIHKINMNVYEGIPNFGLPCSSNDCIHIAKMTIQGKQKLKTLLWNQESTDPGASMLALQSEFKLIIGFPLNNFMAR